MYKGKERLRATPLMRFLLLFFVSLFLASCQSNQAIVNGIDEREANEIIVYLASKGISAQKVQMETGMAGAQTSSLFFNIFVEEKESVRAMAFLNTAGLPRRGGVTLLELFAKQGLMSSDREETIRYQAGLAEELRNTIRKIDGVLDADVQLSFPNEEASAMPGAPPAKVTAAVYIKHQGLLEDPNSHIEIKVKRLLAGSVNGLHYNDVAVISDRARFADLLVDPEIEPIGLQQLQQNYVSIWGIVLSKSSLLRFRVVFFSFILLILGMLGAAGWALYRFFPRKWKEEGKTSPPPELPPEP